MSAADLSILAIVLLSVAIGVVRGFLVEALSLAAWIVAVIAATMLGPSLAGLFEGRVDTPSIRIALGYGIVFLATLMVGALVTWAVRRLVEESGLSGTDRMLGLVFGLVRGVIVIVVLVLLSGLTPFPRDPWWRESRALPSFQLLARDFLPLLPPAVAKHFDWSPEGPQDAARDSRPRDSRPRDAKPRDPAEQPKPAEERREQAPEKT